VVVRVKAERVVVTIESPTTLVTIDHMI